MIVKKFCTLLFATILLACTAQAQTSGYNRLKNAASEHVVNLENSGSFAPNVTEEEAMSLPGTVAWVTFEDNTVTNLQAQNVDLVNVVIPMVKELVPMVITEPVFDALKDSVIDMANTFLGRAVATVLVGAVRRYTYSDFLVYIEEMDTKMYYKETEGGYLLYVNSPKFPLDAGDLTSYVTGKVNGYLSLYMGTLEEMAKEYLVGREGLRPMVNSLIEHFRFGDYFYLSEQQTSDQGPQFAFANSLDLDKHGDRVVWNFLPIDNENQCFGPRGQMQDAEGKWYASFAADFCVELPQGMKAYYVTDVVDAENSLVKRERLNVGYIPHMTPVILELNGPEAADNKMKVLEVVPSIDFELGNALQPATDSLGFLLGKRLQEPSKNYYVVGISEGKLSLVQTDQTFFPANEAFFYLDDAHVALNTSGFLTLADDVEDAIAQVEASRHSTGVIHDLQGRVVKNPTKGIYIINGKKVVYN